MRSHTRNSVLVLLVTLLASTSLGFLELVYGHDISDDELVAGDTGEETLDERADRQVSLFFSEVIDLRNGSAFGSESPLVNDSSSRVRTPVHEYEDVIYVSPSGHRDRRYSRGFLANPFTTIQAAVDSARDNETIILRRDIYAGPGNRDIVIGSKTVHIESEDLEYPVNIETIRNTVIDCGGSISDPHRAFFFSQGSKSQSTISGITIRGGNHTTGGAVYCHSNNSPEFKHCIFTENDAEQGGAVMCKNSSPSFFDCVFINNSASEYGGALLPFDGSEINVEYCYFRNNISDVVGGAICMLESASKIINSIFYSNVAKIHGGAIYSEGDFTTSWGVFGCSFAANRATTGYGGGILNWDSNPAILNCTLVNNISRYRGAGIANDGRSKPQVSNSILWGNFNVTNDNSTSYQQMSEGNPDVQFCCIMDNHPNDSFIPYGKSSQNIDDDPKFRALPDDGGDGWGDDLSTNYKDESENDNPGDLRLTASSPCIGRGSNEIISQVLTTDFYGTARIKGARVDIGAYEY
ncbi:choice-of-anchor Q domain-containing protein [Planctomycetota bacterium]